MQVQHPTQTRTHSNGERCPPQCTQSATPQGASQTGMEDAAGGTGSGSTAKAKGHRKRGRADRLEPVRGHRPRTGARKSRHAHQTHAHSTHARAPLGTAPRQGTRDADLPRYSHSTCWRRRENRCPGSPFLLSKQLGHECEICRSAEATFVCKYTKIDVDPTFSVISCFNGSGLNGYFLPPLVLSSIYFFSSFFDKGEVKTSVNFQFNGIIIL